MEEELEDAAGGEDDSKKQSGEGEDEQEKGDLGEQGDENDGNLPIDNTDKGAAPEEETGDAGGGEEERDQQEAGSSSEQPTGPGGTPEEISEEAAAASQAVDQFDQMGRGPGEEEDPDAKPTGLPDEDAIPGTGISVIMMDQWLEQIEGDPAYLLRNQFMLEERQELDKRGRELMETRPW